MKYLELPENIAHYKIQNILGRGGMGIVYLAEDSRLGRQVAIKCLYKHQQSENLVERLRREAKVLAKLNHPNVIQIYDVVEDEQGLALVMEYVRGRSLKQYLQENSLSQKQKFSLLAQILDGLAAAHGEGIIHRDLKPDNILVDADGRVKIGDFGIAKYYDSNTAELSRHNDSAGSLSAMSPEQIRGEKLSLASDVFAFGLLAWRVLRGHHPFEANNDLMRIEKILNKPAPSLQSEELPQGLSDCIDAALHKSAEQRPQSADELIQELKPYLPSISQRAKNPSVDSRINLKKRNVMTQVWVYIVVVIIVLVTIFTANKEFKSWFNLEPDFIYVAILPPDIESQDELDYEDIRQTVYYALQEGIIDLNESNLIPSLEVENYEGESERLAASLGADVVVNSYLKCRELKCDLVLTRDSGENQVKSKKVHIVEDSMLEVHRITQLKLAELFPNRKGLDILNEVINEEDYKEYIELSRLAKESEHNHVEIFMRLRKLLDKAPKFGPLYYLHTQIGLDLYSETRDDRFAFKVKEVLEMVDRSKFDEREIRLLWIETHAELGEMELALDKVSEFEENYRENRETKSLKGLIEEARENYELAVRHYQAASHMRPSVRTYRDIAINYWYLGEVKKAIDYLEKALALNPKDIHAGLTLATFYMTSGDLDKAERMFLRLEEKSQISSTFDNLGLLYMLRRNYKRAEEYFIKTSKITNDLRSWPLNLADAYALQGETEKARKYYLMVIDKLGDSMRSDQLGSTSQAYIHIGESKKALAALKKAKEIAPDNSDIVYAEAIIYAKLEDYPSALIAIERSISLGLGAIWYSLPWFDVLCKHQIHGTKFKELVGQSCTN
nr:serine/threonine-protein kinase [Pseudoteredinibacter isoporae]